MIITECLGRWKVRPADRSEMKGALSTREFHSFPDCTQSSSQRKKAGLVQNAINSK